MKIRYTLWLKSTTYALCCFLYLRSIAQGKGIDVFNSTQQYSTPKIDIQKINFKPLVINLTDTFLSRPSGALLLRNEHAGIRKKIGRAELFIGGAELLGATVL